MEYLSSAKESLFRFEYLQDFDTPEEREIFRAYKSNGQIEIRPLMQGWWNFLKAKHEEGVITQRVRLVKMPETEYLKWELFIHRQTAQQGDDIRVLSEDQLTEALEQLGDFWLVDDSIALKMNYDSTGKYLGCEEVSVEPYEKAKKYLLDKSSPID